jgi:hypothetical protein
MQNKRMLEVLLLSVVLVTAVIGSASASSVDLNKANNGGYTVTPVTDSAMAVSPMTVSD